jgi:N-sulfoglucosamine sulfohydrolase
MPKRPNILLITTHDSGRHFGCYGIPEVHTPVIDRLAGEGIRLTNYFATVPICCASRASMLTGQYPQTHGLMDLCHPNFGWALRDGERHASHILRDAGYRTTLYGIQHEVVDVETLGFDDVNTQYPIQGDVSHAESVAEGVASFLTNEAGGDRPFYAQVGFLQTHTPFDIGGVKPDDSDGVYVPPYLVRDDDSVAQLSQLQGAIKTVDNAVGTIVNALEDSGLAENTLLIFTTDHGIEVPRAKWNLYDPGIAIALVARWPGGGITGGRTCDHLLGNVGFLPTLLELIGVPIPANVEGHSFASDLRDSNTPPACDAIYGLYHKTNGRFVRTNTHKLIRHFDAAFDYLNVPVAFADVLQKRGMKQVQLYDLENDPNEFEDVSGKPEYAEIQADLNGRLWRWLESVNDPVLRGPVRTPTYERAIGEYERWRG